MSIEEIMAAIRNRVRLLIDYEPGARLVEPHALGRSREGNFLLRGFQVHGASASGEHVNWKLLRLDRFRSIAVTDEVFDGPRDGYKRGDPAMLGGIIEEL